VATREAAGAKPGGRGGRSHSALPAAPQSCRGAPSTSALTCRCSPGPSSPKTHSPDEGAPHWPGGPCASCEAPHMERAEGPLGTVRPGISQRSLQLPHVDTPCALRFWNVAFLAHWDGRVSVLKTRTKKRARSCFLPGCPRPCRLLAAPTPCTGRAMQPRSLRYFGVICCRGRSCLELTQIHIPCPLEAYSPGCCCTFFLRFLQRESSLPYFPQPKKKKKKKKKLCIHLLFLLQSRSGSRDGGSITEVLILGALQSPTLSSEQPGSNESPRRRGLGDAVCAVGVMGRGTQSQPNSRHHVFGSAAICCRQRRIPVKDHRCPAACCTVLALFHLHCSARQSTLRLIQGGAAPCET